MVARIKDQKLLAEIARRGEEELIRTAAVKHIRDSNILSDLARNAPDEMVRIYAAQQGGLF